MKTILPRYFGRSTMYNFIRDTLFKVNKDSNKAIVFDFSSLVFIEPSGITILANFIHFIKKLNCSVSFCFPILPDKPSPRNPIKYLDDTGFFQIFLNKTLFPNSTLRPTTLPFMNIFCSDTVQWLNYTFEPWLKKNINVKNFNGLEEIKVCIQEIFHNISDHSGQKIGCVFGQYFPSNQNPGYEKVKIAISDFGYGIPYNIKNKEGNILDSEALELSILEGYSTKSTPRNRGAGLDVLISNVVKNNGGEVHIHSNNGTLSCLNYGGKAVSNKFETQYYPGTFFEIVFNPSWFVKFDEKEVFSW